MIKTAKEIVKKLQENGFEAYFAGGYVRDLLLGIKSSDIDIVTSAKPDQIESIFSNTHPVGKQFGVMLVAEKGLTFEVATFRRESAYMDHRRPSKVEFTDAKEDALRRDFTINGMFYDPVASRVIDYVGGEDDVKKRVIRFIGDPKERIEEDHLRLVRAIRFKATLGFQYDSQTFDAIRGNAKKIIGVSLERLRDELNKILSCKLRHQALIELSESKILEYLLPEVEKLKGVPQPMEYHHEGDVFTHTYLALKSLDSNSPSHIAWAVLLHDIGKPQTLKIVNQKITFHGHAQKGAKITQDILKRFKFPSYETKLISYLVENHMKLGDIPKMRPSKRYDFLLNPWMNDLILLAKADASGTYPPNLIMIKAVKNSVDEALEWKKQKQKQTDLKIFDGDDLISLGFNPSVKFQEILSQVKDKIVNGEISTKEEAIQYVKNTFQNEYNIRRRFEKVI